MHALLPDPQAMERLDAEMAELDRSRDTTRKRRHLAGDRLKQAGVELADAYCSDDPTRIGAAQLKYREADRGLRSHLRDEDDVLRGLDILISDELAVESDAARRATALEAGLTFWVALLAMVAITVAAYIA
jgi:hypothetical protein